MPVQLLLHPRTLINAAGFPLGVEPWILLTLCLLVGLRILMGGLVRGIRRGTGPGMKLIGIDHMTLLDSVGGGSGSSNGMLDWIPPLGSLRMRLRGRDGDPTAGRWMTGMDPHLPLSLSAAVGGRGKDWLWETSAPRGRVLSDSLCRA